MTPTQPNKPPPSSAANLSVARLVDPDHQDLCNTLNAMARCVLENDETAYDGFYETAIEQLDELHANLSKNAGWEE